MKIVETLIKKETREPSETTEKVVALNNELGFLSIYSKKIM